MNNQLIHKKSFEKALKAFVSFLHDCGIKKIIFHQFDFLIMYFPVYMLIKDLKDKDITVEFEKGNEKDNDIAINKKMANGNFESLDIGEGILHIGLCEPVVFNVNVAFKRRDHVRAENKFLTYKPMKKVGEFELKNECVGENNNSYFLHLPFIKFPPLYGVSLINRPIINKIKRKKSKEGMNRKGKQVLSIVDYWKHFSAKLSLLDNKDFEELTASSYPPGSTTDWFIRHKFQFRFKKVTSVKNLKEGEFKDLFNRKVDVAFTVQPWAALSASELNDPPLDIDIVFKNVCDDKFDCTSLIFKTGIRERLILGDHILKFLNNLLNTKIDELYRMHSADISDIEKSMKYYCTLLSEYLRNKHKDHHGINTCCSCYVPECLNVGKKQTKIKLADGCLFENKMALRLTNDSQIYKHLKEEEIAPAKAVANYFVEKFSKTPEGCNKFQELMRGGSGD